MNVEAREVRVGRKGEALGKKVLGVGRSIDRERNGRKRWDREGRQWGKNER